MINIFVNIFLSFVDNFILTFVVVGYVQQAHVFAPNFGL